MASPCETVLSCQVFSYSEADKPLDVILSVDRSGSIGPQNFLKILEFLRTLVLNFNFQNQR